MWVKFQGYLQTININWTVCWAVLLALVYVGIWFITTDGVRFTTADKQRLTVFRRLLWKVLAAAFAVNTLWSLLPDRPDTPDGFRFAWRDMLTAGTAHISAACSWVCYLGSIALLTRWLFDPAEHFFLDRKQYYKEEGRTALWATGGVAIFLSGSFVIGCLGYILSQLDDIDLLLIKVALVSTVVLAVCLYIEVSDVRHGESWISPRATLTVAQVAGWVLAIAIATFLLKRTAFGQLEKLRGLF